MKKAAFLVCVSILVFEGAPTLSQDFSNFGYSMPDVTFDYAGQSATLMNQNMMIASMLSNRGDSSGGTTTRPSSPAQSGGNGAPRSGSMTFLRSASRTRTNLAAFVAQTRINDRRGADQMAQLFATTDIMGQIGEGIAPYGLRVDNVADAYAVYWVNAWEASRGITNSIETRERAQAVKAQAARAIAAAPLFTNATDAQKQEIADSLFIQAALISAFTEAAATNPTQMRAVSTAVSTGARRFGLDLDKVELTPNGFVGK